MSDARSEMGALLLLALGGGCSSAGGVPHGDGGLPAPNGCTNDSTVQCAAASTAFTCLTGVNPTDSAPNLSCSAPAATPTGGASYCCFQWYGGPSCVPNDTLPTCAVPSAYGYQCTGGDNPTSGDPRLACDQGVLQGTLTNYCCTLP